MSVKKIAHFADIQLRRGSRHEEFKQKERI